MISVSCANWGYKKKSVAFTFVQFADFGFINIEPQYLVTDIDITQHQRQANITQTDNTDFGGFVGKLLNSNIFHDFSHVIDRKFILHGI